MAIKKLKPTTPGQRFRVAPTFSEVTKSTPEKSLVVTNEQVEKKANQVENLLRFSVFDFTV